MTARVVMIQGTSSHAGKSILTAALCRIFAREGLRVAPFKAQNMALNSFVTLEGGEIGRAQAYQARAAGVDAHVDMNPVLLKPNSETGSQVIVLGKPIANMKVREYHAYQKEVWPTVTAALNRLRAQNDVVVIEGAGSPAEINLRSHDIVNMAVALYAQSPVLLVGDIDRGGVFASLYGTTELVSPAERALIKGFVINKFRGDASLLNPGFQFLQERTGIPTLGVIPYLKGWKGEEEDSLGLEESLQHKPNAPLKICVIRLPFLSNYTDFDSLAAESDVNVVFVSQPNELENADAVIVPGTKSTLADLKWLQENGFHGALKVCLKRTIPVIGICGGYQMLGKTLSDPQGVESGTAHAEGLNFVNVHTEFLPEKRTVQVHGQTLSDAMGCEGNSLVGYEIHMGRTTRALGVKPFCALTSPSGSPTEDGAVSPDGLVVGTYLHGLFDEPAFRRTWLNTLRTSKNLPPLTENFTPTNDIDTLANHIATHMSMDAIRRIVFSPPESSRQDPTLA
jgi:adenosylcobyric acid synthase